MANDPSRLQDLVEINDAAEQYLDLTLHEDIFAQSVNRNCSMNCSETAIVSAVANSVIRT